MTELNYTTQKPIEIPTKEEFLNLCSDPPNAFQQTRLEFYERGMSGSTAESDCIHQIKMRFIELGLYVPDYIKFPNQ